MTLDKQQRRDLYNELVTLAKRLECHVCHSPLAGKGSNFFCPECRLAVSHESQRQTMARREFFSYLDKYEEGRSKPLQCMRDERWSRNRPAP